MAIQGGYYLKARKIRESKIAHCSPCVREIFDWLLCEANYNETNVCKRGQLVRSYKDIQEGLEWHVGWRKMAYSKDSCEAAMKTLTKLLMITTKKTTRGMLITLLNYDKYQSFKNYEDHNEDSTKTTGRPHDPLHYKESKENKEVKETNNNKQPVAASPPGVQEVMKAFYEVNPTINFGNRTERKVAADLVGQFGLEAVLGIVGVLKETNAQPYAPVITTPSDLKNKMAKLQAFLAQRSNKKSQGSKTIVL